MEKNVKKTSVVNASASLEDKEGFAVGLDGVLTASTGDFVYGIVSQGRPAGEASEIIVSGECEAEVNAATAIAVEDPLTGGASGRLVKATIGSHIVRAIAKEALASGTGTIKVLLYG